jgi:hypothetical protein
VPEPTSFEYAVVRVVPSPQREEFINVGVILLCRERRFLQAAIRLDAGRLAALAPSIDADMVRQQLDIIDPICRGDSQAGSLAELSLVERFRWLISPRSTVIQVSPVHCGLCTDPALALLETLARMVP